jgi:DegV family protein with EDD domain
LEVVAKVSKVGIIVDSAVSIPKELIREYGIQVVPLVAIFSDKSYRDLIDLKTPNEIFQLIDKSAKFPTTSAPSPSDYLNVYRRVSEKVVIIFFVYISAALSMCFRSATLAKEMAQNELPKVKIEVFDSRTTVGAMGLITLAAARAAASGKDIAQVVEAAKGVRSRVNMIFIFDTLSYLAKSGRIGRAAALMGNMLSIKPIVEVSTATGLVEPVGRVRTKPKAVKYLLEVVEQRVGVKKPVHMMVEHTRSLDEAKELKQMVSDQFNCVELLLCEFNPVAALITGPKMLGLSFYRD